MSMAAELRRPRIARDDAAATTDAERRDRRGRILGPRRWWLLGRRARPRWSRAKRVRVAVLSVVLLLLLPVPWMHVTGENPVSHAWKLDGRLFVDDQVIDPSGRWSWLAIGRPPLVIELLRDRVLGTDSPPADMRAGPMVHAPSLSEPAAAAVGLRAAGFDVPMRLLVEVREPRLAGLPETAVIAYIEGVAVDHRAAWQDYLDRADPGPLHAEGRAEPARAGRAGTDPGGVDPGTLRFTTRTGDTYEVPGSELPYDKIHTLDLAPVGLRAGIAPPWARIGPVEWFRSLSLGSSHGMMVALTTYADAVEYDVAQGRHIAGTGGIRGDGTVTRIGGLEAKATAARRQGVDVMFFPASQAQDLVGFEPRGMTLVPIETLADAIEFLARPLA